MAERDLIPTAADYGRLLEDVPVGQSPASALRAPTPVPGLSVGDPSEFREPTLAGHVLGRYAPSSLLSDHWNTVAAPGRLLGLNPDTREGRQWQRKVGGLLDDMIAAPALMWAPFAVKEGAQGIGAMRSAARASEAAKGAIRVCSTTCWIANHASPGMRSMRRRKDPRALAPSKS